MKIPTYWVPPQPKLWLTIDVDKLKLVEPKKP